MNRVKSLRATKEFLASQIALSMIGSTSEWNGFQVESASPCIDDPKVVQIVGRLWYDGGRPMGETVQLEVYIKEITG